MMDAARQKAVVLKFNDYINNQDLDGLATLMTDNHALIIDNDPTQRIERKKRVIEAWREFFKLFPDYRNIFDNVESQGDFVRIIGHSTCSDKRLDGPALWMARIKDNKVAEWCVYDDTSETRRSLGFK